MIVTEGRKEIVFDKFRNAIENERVAVSNYLSSGLPSLYDYVLTDPFMIDTNFKYLDDLMSHHYGNWNREIEPLPKNQAEYYVQNNRNEIDKIIESLKFFDIHNKKYKYPEFKKYIEDDIFEFLKETEELKDELVNKKGKKEIVKVFENDRVLIVRPESYESSCLYGAGTRWCTSSKSTSQHFQNYSESGKLYYLITKNVDSSNKFYKVALFRNEEGQDKWYDATDRELSENEIELLKSAYGEGMSQINSDFSKFYQLTTKGLEIFEIMEGDNFSTEVEISKREPKLSLIFDFQKPTISTEQVEVGCKLYFKKNKEEFLIGDYTLVIKTQCKPSNCLFTTTVAQFGDESVDLPNLNGAEFIKNLRMSNSSKKEILDYYLNEISRRMYFRIKNNRNFLNTNPILDGMILSTSPDKGYTFKNRSRGLIKRLTDWLDSGKVGSKLDFFTDSKILIKTPSGYVATSSGSVIEPRGYLSTFFNAVSGAGIVQFKRQGKKTLMLKGPNYEKFKEGYPIIYF